MNIFFERLARVESFEFLAQSQSGSQMNWHQQASGKVLVVQHENMIDFEETFYFDNGRTAQDRKRWLLGAHALEFHRFRNGDFERIFTFSPRANHQWRLQTPYWCAPDEYAADLCLQENAVELTIYIKSEKKNEKLHYVYRPFQAA